CRFRDGECRGLCAGLFGRNARLTWSGPEPFELTGGVGFVVDDVRGRLVFQRRNGGGATPDVVDHKATPYVVDHKATPYVVDYNVGLWGWPEILEMSQDGIGEAGLDSVTGQQF